jgi:AraC-like DNA-binding protein
LAVPALFELAGKGVFGVTAPHIFVLVTLEYVKPIRLHKALMLTVHEGLRAGVAAGRVGYESASQFTREFKRLFGKTAIEEVARVQRMLGVPQARRVMRRRCLSS